MFRRAVAACVSDLLASTSGRGAAAPGLLAAPRRALQTTPAPSAAAEVVAGTPAERAIADKIAAGLLGATSVRVEDT
jgi:hypothetical protein